MLTLLQETGLMSIPDHLTFVQAAFVIKTVKNRRKSLLQRRILEDLVTNRDILPLKTWSLKMSQLVDSLLPGNNLALHGPDYPQTSMVTYLASFIVYKPHEGKADCSMWEHRTKYMEQIEPVNQGANIVVYTYVSIDEQGRAGSGIYATTYGLQISSQTLFIRISRHASILQTKVAAIHKTLECLKSVTWSG